MPDNNFLRLHRPMTGRREKKQGRKRKGEREKEKRKDGKKAWFMKDGTYL